MSTDESKEPEIEGVDPGDPEWQLEGDDSVGDADDPHRNDAGQFDHAEAVSFDE